MKFSHMYLYIGHCTDVRRYFPLFGGRARAGGTAARESLLCLARALQRYVRCCSVLHVAVCCSVLQCVAVCCRVLQCVAVYCSVLQCIAVCCSICFVNTHRRVSSLPPQSAPKVCTLLLVLQCVAACCSVLQCVAVCCSVLQCVAVCCSESPLCLARALQR